MRRGTDILDRQELMAGIHALHRDAGGTIITDVFLEHTLVISYQPGTRNLEVARNRANSMSLSILQQLFMSAATQMDLVATTQHRLLHDEDYNDGEEDYLYQSSSSGPINAVAYVDAPGD
jgi:hypothetical protein